MTKVVAPSDYKWINYIYNEIILNVKEVYSKLFQMSYCLFTAHTRRTSDFFSVQIVKNENLVEPVLYTEEARRAKRLSGK